MKRVLLECAGGKAGDAKIRDPLARGPYALTEEGYRSKFDEDHKQMVHAFNDMRGAGETVSVPLMALALTDSGESEAYAPMEIEGPSGEAEERDPAFADATVQPAAADAEDGDDAERGVAQSAYFKRYRGIRAFGFKLAKVGRDRLRESLTDYNIFRISGYAARRARFPRHPDGHIGPLQLYGCDSCIYEGEISRYAWATVGESAIQAQGQYRRWGIKGRPGCERDLVGEDSYDSNQPPTKNERNSRRREKT